MVETLELVFMRKPPDQDLASVCCFVSISPGRFFCCVRRRFENGYADGRSAAPGSLGKLTFNDKWSVEPRLARPSLERSEQWRVRLTTIGVGSSEGREMKFAKGRPNGRSN